MMKTQKKHKGLLSVELVVTISVLVIIISTLLALNTSFGKLNTALWARHSCYSAAQAQLDAIAVTGEPIDPDTFKRLWPQVACTIEQGRGTGDWQGLKKIDLVLTKQIKAKEVRIQVTRYLPPADGGAQ